jgi:hypothetical protein
MRCGKVPSSREAPNFNIESQPSVFGRLEFEISLDLELESWNF